VSDAGVGDDDLPGGSPLFPSRPSGAEDLEVAPAGHFRIYLGVAPGVGKTYAMLSEGRRRALRGTDVVVGFVECHRRVRTEALLGGFEIVPRRRVVYRGSVFEEMDRDAVIARRPRVALIDELAHTNVPGSGPHEKRWQDVLDVLEAGIDVITTVNIQHLESLAPVVERMTGTPVRERVPDWVVRRANQIELVDSSPEQLRRRMLHGNIYPPERVHQALNNFFRTENLIALRELALRFLADETEEDLLERLRRKGAAEVWETAERFLVGVAGSPRSEELLHRAARLAARSRAPLHVLHVSGGDARPGEREALAKLRRLAEDLGATWEDAEGDDPARVLVERALAGQVTQIVVGSGSRSRLREAIGGSLLSRLLREAARAGISVHVVPVGGE
jgi:two-component system sensor histidine kinase KdpD